jgi:hypothetical protein
MLVGVCLHIPMSVRAFSDPQAYEDPVDLGGGAGRWFTGSTVDGYGCDVCHTGAAGADLTITGLPITGFTPNKAYEVSLTWPVTAQHLALIAEFTDDKRKGAGAIALPRPETLKPDELCGADLAGELAATVHDADGGRHLVSVIDCGARKLRFQWTSPPTAVEPLWFNVGFVVSNQDATPGGDGVTLVRRPLPAAGQSLPVRTIAQGCSAAPVRTRNGFAMLLLLLPLSAACLRRRLRP